MHLCKSTLEVTKNHSLLKQIAYCEHKMREVDQALNYYQQALNLCAAEDEQELASIYHYLGMLKADNGEVDEAIALYNQSLEINERIGNVRTQAMTLWWLGDLAEQQGEYTKAISYLQPALKILQRLQSPDAESVSASLNRVIRNS
ncbi:tetratricopeptide repeat protein [Komarekiella sp. 'clone 1']|uniref:Tetratricopeptide repeat protein n=1 Tax=Komarekiella delphini-convector SJRDD-AB1 TaxID=2593771 RepID=A0AA40VQ52_9NOST|nr:tetratricopeptide repeat protein [Komarekiella delphini-convector SJRDD-AB1]